MAKRFGAFSRTLARNFAGQEAGTLPIEKKTDDAGSAKPHPWAGSEGAISYLA